MDVREATPSPPLVLVADVNAAIASALERNAMIDACNIRVTCDGPDIWLRGHAQSWASVRHAADAAWATPGVRFVHNELRVHGPTLDEWP